MDEAVEDGVGDRRIADDLIPAIDRHLAGEEDRPGIVAIFDDLEEIATLVGAERLGSPIVEDEEVDAGDLAQELGVATVGAREGQGGEQAGDAMIGDGEIVPACLMPKRAGEPAFADAAWPGDQQIVLGADPVAA